MRYFYYFDCCYWSIDCDHNVCLTQSSFYAKYFSFLFFFFFSVEANISHSYVRTRFSAAYMNSIPKSGVRSTSTPYEGLLSSSSSTSRE